MIAVIQAAKDGKKIEAKSKSDQKGIWFLTLKPLWDFERFDYRIVDEPKLLDKSDFKLKESYVVMSPIGNVYTIHEAVEDGLKLIIPEEPKARFFPYKDFKDFYIARVYWKPFQKEQ